MIQLGIIGTGMIVREFLPVFASLPEYELRGILSTRRSLDKARALSEEYAIPCATDELDALCASGIDTVYIAVPNMLHRDYCVRAMERGLNVIVEKPLACTVEEVRALRALAEEKSCFLFEAITTIYLPAYQKIKALLPRIGPVKLVQSQFCQFSSRYRAFERGELAPVFDPKQAGGAMMDLNVYNLHFVMGIFGSPLSVRYIPSMERGVDTGGLTLLRYDGFQGLCTAAKSCGGAGWGLIQGRDGCIRTTNTPNCVGDVVLEMNGGATERHPGTQEHARCVPELQVFARAIEEKDWALCRRRLAQSEAVSGVMTRARRAAGIWFPGENGEG